SFGVSFYTIDARGLAAVPGIGPASRSGDVSAHANPDQDPQERAERQNPRSGSQGAPERGNTEQMVSTFTLTDVGSLEDSQNTLVALAAGTNGAAFYNTNDLGSVLRASTAEQENYYLLSYAPSSRRKEGRFHRINVKSRRRGVHLRARRGYLDTPAEELRRARIPVAFQRRSCLGSCRRCFSWKRLRGRFRR
ncbi:MAG: hypothetical protein ACE5JX_22970, partial [Acidobacteriota bacterium]